MSFVRPSQSLIELVALYRSDTKAVEEPPPQKTDTTTKTQGKVHVPVLSEAILLAEDAYGAQAQLIPRSHDTNSDLSSVGCHEALERHVETRPISRNLGREQCPASGRAKARHGTPEQEAPARPQQQTRSKLHDTLR